MMTKQIIGHQITYLSIEGNAETVAKAQLEMSIHQCPVFDISNMALLVASYDKMVRVLTH